MNRSNVFSNRDPDTEKLCIRVTSDLNDFIFLSLFQFFKCDNAK